MNNGKGDAPRPVNLKVYRENYAAIDWRRNSVSEQDSHFFPCRESHLKFMRSMGYKCATEAEAYRLRGLLDL